MKFSRLLLVRQNFPNRAIRDIPAERLRGVLGLTTVGYVENSGPLAIADSTLG